MALEGILGSSDYLWIHEGCRWNQVAVKQGDYCGSAPYIIIEVLQGGRGKKEIQNQRGGGTNRLGPALLALKMEEEDQEPRNVGGKECGQAGWGTE